MARTSPGRRARGLLRSRAAVTLRTGPGDESSSYLTSLKACERSRDIVEGDLFDDRCQAALGDQVEDGFDWRYVVDAAQHRRTPDAIP